MTGPENFVAKSKRRNPMKSQCGRPSAKNLSFGGKELNRLLLGSTRSHLASITPKKKGQEVISWPDRRVEIEIVLDV
jgi:hypothetical protein